MAKRTAKKKVVKKPAAKNATVGVDAKKKALLKAAKADFSEAKKKEAACRKAVATAQRECIDQHPNAKDAGAKYRGAVSAHVKAISVRVRAAAAVARNL